MTSTPDDERWQPPVGPVDPEHPECAAVIAEVWTLLDGECTAETRDKLRQHLEDCPTCLRHYGVEERVKTLIARKCGGDKAPDSLRERLRLEISRTTIIRRGEGLLDGFRAGVGPLAVVGLGMLTVTLLAATLGHGRPPLDSQGIVGPHQAGARSYSLMAWRRARRACGVVRYERRHRSPKG